MPVRRRRKSHRTLYIFIIGILAIVGISAYLIQVFNPCDSYPFPQATSSPIHYHVDLMIVINGKNVSIPAGIGGGDSGVCIQPLHNHVSEAGTNVIHIETPINRTYTLGDYFTVWAHSPNVQGPKPVIFNQNSIFNYTVSGGNELRMYVNGQQSTAYGLLPLQAHEIVVIVYGNYSPTDWSTYQSISAKPWPYPGY